METGFNQPVWSVYGFVIERTCIERASRACSPAAVTGRSIKLATLIADFPVILCSQDSINVLWREVQFTKDLTK
ncbi:hypothetical protein J6590_058707 [Homalodisca vitripennis]|nr:hypothetical protein J6590_058707 [Homalodisca vitripennis]